MVRLYEYQGKELLKNIGLRIPNGGLASTPIEARKIAEKIDKPFVVKAQIWATGRFKAGGIKFGETPKEAEKVAQELLKSEIKGFVVDKILIEEKINIEKEFYAGVIIDDSFRAKSPLIIFSTEGGVDIEEVAKKTPEKTARLSVDILQGPKIDDVKKMLSKMNISSNIMETLSSTIMRLYEVFRKNDARSAEINPLVLSKTGEIIAVDCRIVIDDNSVQRHPELGIKIPRESNRPPTELDQIAWSIEENDYRGVGWFAQLEPEIKDKGYVGFHGMGGGGAMLGADALLRHGLKLANYADTSGNPTGSKVYRIAKVILSQPGIEAYVAMDPNISSQEMWFTSFGLLKAFREDLKNKNGFPFIYVLAGNKEKEAIDILTKGLKDLPIRFEIYGREYIYNVDFIAERVKTLVEEYRKQKGVN